MPPGPQQSKRLKRTSRARQKRREALKRQVGERQEPNEYSSKELSVRTRWSRLASRGG